MDAGATSATLVVHVPDAPVWWPAGYGEQPLADLTLTLSTDNQELDSWQRRIGFRTVELNTARDEIGTAFTLSINGQPVFVKGVNWIPDDHFLTRITAERLGRRLDQAVSANINLIRVWGGGIFESEAFYRACDERGLLVWQDFLLACAAYPEESPLWEEIEAEARENVVRLMPHPSLVLFNGGNENLWGEADWNWRAALHGRTWGARYAFELFPKIVAELDPTRPYCDNSPYSPRLNGDAIHPNDPDHGTHHQWEVWNHVDYTAYRSEIPRFCSEFGFQAPPAWRTLIDSGARCRRCGRWIPASDPKNDGNFLLHQKAEDGNGKLDRGLAPHLGVPEQLRGLALGHAAQSGTCCHLRDRSLPAMVAADGGRDRMAAQRLLASHLVGGDRLRGAAQAAVVRLASRICAAQCGVRYRGRRPLGGDHQ